MDAAGLQSLCVRLRVLQLRDLRALCLFMAATGSQKVGAGWARVHVRFTRGGGPSTLPEARVSTCRSRLTTICRYAPRAQLHTGGSVSR